MEKIEVLSLGIEGLEAVALASRPAPPAGTTERVPSSHLEDPNVSACEERVP